MHKRSIYLWRNSYLQADNIDYVSNKRTSQVKMKTYSVQRIFVSFCSKLLQYHSSPCHYAGTRPPPCMGLTSAQITKNQTHGLLSKIDKIDTF